MKSGKLARKLWWFDVVYPIALATFLFGSLTYIVYEGQRQWRLAVQGESKLIEASLEEAKGRPVRRPDESLVVSATVDDVAHYGRAPLGSYPDATPATYARVLTKLAQAGTRLAFVHWDTDAHPADEVYYLPLIEAMKRIHHEMHVYLVIQRDKVSSVPQALRKLVTVNSDDPCLDDPKVLQFDCPYVEDEWVHWSLVRELGPTTGSEQALPSWVSRELTSLYPMYLLNLSDPESLRHVSFRDWLEGSDDVLKHPPRVAYVGPDQSFSVSGHDESDVPRNVLTIYDSGRGAPEVTGTPLHVFWAMVGQMFLDDALVAVPSLPWIVALTIGLCCTLVLVMRWRGALAALTLFVIYAVAGPYLNAAGIRYLKLYVPLFDSYYFGFFTFIVAGLGQLSTSAYRRWRLEAQRRLHAQMADLKGNFISLLSHNLNTPVAKMQGMLALLSSQAKGAAWGPRAAAAEALVSQLEFSIRSVLVASALEEGALNEQPRTATALIDELLSTQAPGLKRMGVLLTSAGVGADEEDGLFLPLAFDVRAVTAAIGALAALFNRPGAQVPVKIRSEVITAGGQDDAVLNVTLTAESQWLSPRAAEVLLAELPPQVRSLGTVAFFDELMAGLVVLAVSVYRGRLVLDRHGDGGSVSLTLRSAGPGSADSGGTRVAT